MPLNMPLYDQAAKASEEKGLDAYWETLSADPRKKPPASTTRSRVGPGYTDQRDGSGHASDQIVPLDKMFALK